jgi:hypothetical protein
VFPVNVAGSVRLPTAVPSDTTTIRAVADRIAVMLHKEGIKDVLLERNHVRFKNATFELRPYNHNIWDGFGSGAFNVDVTPEGITIRYALNWMRVLLMLAVISTFFLLAPVEPEKLSWYPSLSYRALLFGSFFVLYPVMIWIRVPRWLRKGLCDLPELKSVSK